jgi:PAS domain S-box-containing protein
VEARHQQHGADFDAREEAFARLTAEACAAGDALQITRGCAALRDTVLEECALGTLPLDQARAIIRSIDESQERVLARLSPPREQDPLATFEWLVEWLPLPVLCVDLGGGVRIWNRASEEQFGWRREEVLGKPAPFVPPGSEAEAQAMLDEAYSGKTIRGRESRRVRKDGTEVELSLSVAPVRDVRGAVAGCIAILADISDQKRRERETGEAARFREHLIGVVGHDLRNPLTAIITSAQLLLRFGRLNDRQSRVVNRVASSADRMARMIDDLLDFARTRLGGGFPIHPRRIDLGELTERTVEELRFAHPDRTVRITAEGDLWGNWDADRMEQVVSNLVGNALQHGPDEGEVTVTLLGEAQVVVLSTHNGGLAIPSEVLPYIFEPGRRGDVHSGGLGLGLFIVQQIVLAHGGSIEARSSPEEGTTFTAVLPRKARGKV